MIRCYRDVVKDVLSLNWFRVGRPCKIQSTRVCLLVIMIRSMMWDMGIRRAARTTVVRLIKDSSWGEGFPVVVANIAFGVMIWMRGMFTWIWIHINTVVLLGK